MSLRFGATAAAPELAAAWGLGPAETAWLTTAVQLGFVAGAALPSVLALSAVVAPRRPVAGSALVGAGLTPAIAAFVLVWGVAIVADSARFSAAVSELAEGAYAGTALALQTAVGLLLTTLSIGLVPVVAEAVGRWAFLPLAAGPLGMSVLLWLPEAAALAGGRRENVAVGGRRRRQPCPLAPATSADLRARSRVAPATV